MLVLVAAAAVRVAMLALGLVVVSATIVREVVCKGEVK